MEKFNQKKYIQNYQNEHYSIFKVKLTNFKKIYSKFKTRNRSKRNIKIV